MKNFGKVLKELRNSRGMTQEEVAEALDIEGETISRMERSDRPPAKGSTYRRMVEFYGKTVDEVNGMWQTRSPTTDASPLPVPKRPVIPGNFTIRRVSGVAATDFGTDFEVDLMNEEGVPGYLYPYPLHDPMVLRVVGSSMSCDGGESIEEGDDVIFANELEEPVVDGEIVVARHIISDTQTVKKLQRLPGDIINLVPLNPRFKAFEVPSEHVILRAVKVVVRYRYKRNIKGR